MYGGIRGLLLQVLGEYCLTKPPVCIAEGVGKHGYSLIDALGLQHPIAGYAIPTRRILRECEPMISYSNAK